MWFHVVNESCRGTWYREQRDHIMRQVVAYKRLKIKKNYKTVKQKSGRGRLWEFLLQGIDWENFRVLDWR